jgi:ribosomal protein S6--L-glutamate ligase
MARIAILSTRTSKYHPNQRLLETGFALGYEPYLLHPRRVLARTNPANTDLWTAAARPDVFLPRIGSTIDDAELTVVFHMERLGIPPVNGFQALFTARDKFLSLRHLDHEGIPVPRSYLVSEGDQLASVIEEIGGFPVILKTPRGRQGIGVYLVEKMSHARYILDHPPVLGMGIVVQEYIPSAESGDTRIVVVGERPVASMKRVPKKGDFRSNVHLRGKGHRHAPDPSWLKLAKRATRALGLHVAGVDLLEGADGPMVLEVNTTPGFRELERVSGVDVAAEIIGYAVHLTKGR